MSVLLNALKKASEDKKRRELAESKNPEPSKANSLDDIAASESRSSSEDFTMSILHDSAEPQSMQDHSASSPSQLQTSDVNSEASSFNLSFKTEDKAESSLQETDQNDLLTNLDSTFELEKTAKPVKQDALSLESDKQAMDATVKQHVDIPPGLVGDTADDQTKGSGAFDLKLSALNDVEQSVYQTNLDKLDDIEVKDDGYHSNNISKHIKEDIYPEPQAELSKKRANSALESQTESESLKLDDRLQMSPENNNVNYVAEQVQKDPSVERIKAKKVKNLLLANKPTRPASSSSFAKRMSFYLLLFMVIFMTLAYYGLSSYQKMESEYERDVNYLLNIISQAEREAVGNQTRSDEAKELGLAKKEQFIHDIKDPIISAEDRKLLLPKVVNEQQPLPLVDVADKQPVAAKPTPQVQMPKSTIRVEKQVTKSFAEMGYEAYVKGDMFEAQQHYQRHLQAFPQSKAARLGLAAIAAEHGESAVAIEYYQQVLKSDPNDVDALSGLAVIASNLNTQFFSLGDLQQLVRRHPNSAALQFALGNHYAQKQDWFLAQPAFFEAVRLEGQNPDYRLNLAISFDQLREYYEAITHYKIAIALASNENKDFQRASINQRVMDLERFLEQR